MNVSYRAGMFFFSLLFLPLSVFAQQQQGAPSDAAKNQLILDVVVTDKPGKPIGGLEEKDFAVRDKGQPAKIASFRAVGPGAADEPPAKIMLFVDEVNTSFTRLATERIELNKFLQQNDGKLTHPLAMYFFSDTNLEKQSDFTTDGKALLALFDKHVTALRSDRRAGGIYGEQERFQRSLNALNSIAASEAHQPGRKIMIWLSPGWPILAGVNVTISPSDQKALFTSIVAVSTALRQARITLDMIDPLGARDDKDHDAQGVNYYEEFLKPVTDSKGVEAGHLALQVIAAQSGGLVLNVSNDIVGQLNRCIAEADAYYTLTLDLPPADKPNTYHAIDVKVDVPKEIARARRGYYAQP